MTETPQSPDPLHSLGQGDGHRDDGLDKSAVQDSNANMLNISSLAEVFFSFLFFSFGFIIEHQVYCKS
jgi:hypothetical protein